MIINADENHAVLPQKIAGKEQTWIHHVQPFGMKAAIGFGVRAELVPVGVYCPVYSR